MTGLIPEGCTQIRIVDSADALLREKFTREVNAHLFPRRLSGDFNKLARYAKGDSFVLRHYSYDQFREKVEAATDADIKTAGAQVLNDMRWALDSGLKETNLFVFPRGEGVTGFHADDGKTGVLLCSYNAAATQWIRNEDACCVSDIWFEANPGSDVHAFDVGDMSFHASAGDQSTQGFIHRAPLDYKMPRLLLIGYAKEPK